VKDVERFGPKVVVGGYAFCDDIGWTGGKVSEAITKLMLLGFKQFYALDQGALFQRQSQ